MNASIKEGGIARLFDKVKRVLTKLQGGGNQTWVPESGTRLTTKSIDKNGVYRAVDDGDYGWSTVYVNVPTTSSVTGKGDDGNDYTYTVDSGGNIVNSKVPSEIRITVPPNYTGPYGDGAYLSFEGIVVHAYDAQGNDMGAVPFGELDFPVTVARYDPEAPTTPDTSTSNLDTSPIEQPISSQQSIVISQTITESRVIRYIYTGVSAKCYSYTTQNGANHAFVFAGNSEFVLDYEKHDPETGDTYNTITPDMSTYTYDGKTVYYVGINYSGDFGYPNVPPICYEGVSAPSETSIAMAAWTIVYGETVAGGNMQVPVEWSRTGDGLVLETAFGVTVVPGPSGGDDT